MCQVKKSTSTFLARTCVVGSFEGDTMALYPFVLRLLSLHLYSKLRDRKRNSVDEKERVCKRKEKNERERTRRELRSSSS